MVTSCFHGVSVTLSSPFFSRFWWVLALLISPDLKIHAWPGAATHPQDTLLVLLQLCLRLCPSWAPGSRLSKWDFQSSRDELPLACVHAPTLFPLSPKLPSQFVLLQMGH